MGFRPGPALVRLAVLLTVASLLVSVLPVLVYAVLLAAVLLVTATLVEAARLRAVRLQVDGWHDRVVSIGETEALGLTVRAATDAALRLRVRVTWPDLVRERASAQETVLRPGESAALAFPVQGRRRGRTELAPPHFALTFWGLAEHRLRAGTPGRLSVFPDMRSVKKVHATLNQLTLRGLGNRMSARLGKGREFDRLREYVLGDEYRDISWKASARHGKLIAREHRLDRSQDILICLDLGHRMAARVSGLTRLDHAVNAAVTLAYVCNRMEDRTAILSFAADAATGPGPARGSTHLARTTEFAASRQAEYVHTDYPGLAVSVKRVLRRRGLVVLFTTVPEREADQLLKAVRMMSPPHLVLVVSLVDVNLAAAARLLPASRQELTRTLVARDLALSRERTVRELRGLGAMVVEVAPGDAGLAAMNAYIEVKRRQML
jgi:uncharacterized protein (DUF58 family)